MLFKYLHASSFSGELAEQSTDDQMRIAHTSSPNAKLIENRLRIVVTAFATAHVSQTRPARECRANEGFRALLTQPSASLRTGLVSGRLSALCWSLRIFI